jgi:3-dehydroquinate dehydratase I
MTTKPIELDGRPIAGGKIPIVCTPLVGRDAEALVAEARKVVAKGPDIIEWRVDYFRSIADTAAVVAVAQKIRNEAAGIPILFTRRSTKEGGEPIALDEEGVVSLYAAVCASKLVDLVDFEAGNDATHVQAVRANARESGRKLVLSYHNFSYTPGLEQLNQRFLEAERLGADVAKVAVMPRDLDDVLRLLASTLESSRKLRIPLISMAMGGFGSVTRMLGGVFGSALSFAVGETASAPGQVPIADMNTVLAIVDRAIAGK